MVALSRASNIRPQSSISTQRERVVIRLHLFRDAAIAKGEMQAVQWKSGADAGAHHEGGCSVLSF